MRRSALIRRSADAVKRLPVFTLSLSLVFAPLAVTFVSSAVSAQDEGGLSFGEDELDAEASEPEASPEEASPEESAPEESTPEEASPEESPEAEAAGDAVEEKEAIDNAVDLNQADRIKAVSRKTFLKRGRFHVSPMVGTTINDSFFRHYLVGAAAGFHLVENLSIEVSGAFNVFTESLPPIDFLRQKERAVPIEVLLFGHAEIGAMFSPIYGKFAVFSEWIIHFDAYIAGGVGIVSDSTQEIPLYPAANIGVGGRVFVLPWLVVRADLRDFAYAQQIGSISTLQNLLVFSAGVSLYIPFGFDYENEAFRVVDAG